MLLRVSGDSGLYGGFWRGYGRNSKHCGHIPSLVVVASDAPRITLASFGVSGEGERFDITFPSCLTLEDFSNRHGCQPNSRRAMHVSDGA